MIELIRSKLGLRIRELYFAGGLIHSPQTSDVDVYVQSQLPIAGGEIFCNILIDLARDEELLFRNLTKGCRYEVRRAAEKDGVVCNITFEPSLKILEDFISFYNEFAMLRKLAPANLVKLEHFLAKGRVSISSAFMKDTLDCPLAMHCYIHDSKRIRLYLSATRSRLSVGQDDKQRIGRANKLLHWEDVRSAKQHGLGIYDFGGISTGGRLKGIDDFKRQFGGDEREEYNAMLARSPLGHIALGLLRLGQKIPRWGRS